MRKRDRLLMVRQVFLVLGLLLLLEVQGQSPETRRVKTVSVYEGERLHQLTRYDQYGNECFNFWDSEITKACAMEYDSLGRLVKQTCAHCNVGCWEAMYVYEPGVERTFITEFPRKAPKRFPREEAYSMMLRKVLDADALDALPEILAIRRKRPRLTDEEYVDSLGRLAKSVSYERDNHIETSELQYSPQGRLVKELRYSTDGDTSIVYYHYEEPCREATHEHQLSNRVRYWKFGKEGRTAEVYRTCDEQGNTVREIMVDNTGSKLDTVLIEEKRYSFDSKPVLYLSSQYGPLMPQKSHEYDARGNEIRYVSYSPGGPVHLTRTYRYNEHDEVLDETVTEFERTMVLKYRYEYW